MPVEIIKKTSRSFGVKLAIGVIIASILLGLLLRFGARENINEEELKVTLSERELSPIGTKGLLVPVVYLSVGENEKEQEWTNSLARLIGGRTEVEVDYGRVDIVTDLYAIEVDFFKKWKEGIGQAIHYGDAANKIPVLALIEDNVESEDQENHTGQIEHIEKLCTEKGVKLILLKTRKSG